MHHPEYCDGDATISEWQAVFHGRGGISVTSGTVYFEPISYFLQHELMKSSDSQIANRRIRVERVIARIENFEILKGPVPLSMIHNMNKIWRVCTRLTSFVYPDNVIRDVSIINCETSDTAC